jgi:hypothetical protein
MSKEGKFQGQTGLQVIFSRGDKRTEDKEYMSNVLAPERRANESWRRHQDKAQFDHG